MTEQERYGAVQAPAEPIPVSQSPFIVSTQSPTAPPNEVAMRAYNATIRKDLETLRLHRED